jgi:RNase adaptor protein for sRNA GlmZ degradation
LRPLTGRDPQVGRFIESDPAYAPFFASLTALLCRCCPASSARQELRHHCDRLHRRSPSVGVHRGAAGRLAAAHDRMVGVRHRDAAGLAVDES